MTELSPAAQAVDAALAACIQLQGEIIRARPLAAAALEAAADQVVPSDPCGNDCCITQCEQIRQDVLAIAAELRGTTPTETP